jgi:hypothetical protein
LANNREFDTFAFNANPPLTHSKDLSIR